MAKIVARSGLRKVFEFWTVFPAKNQAFEEKFGFCRAAGRLCFTERLARKFLSRGIVHHALADCKVAKKEALQSSCKPLETALRNLFSFGQKSAVYQVGKRVFV